MNALLFCIAVLVAATVYWFIIPRKWRNIFLLICSLVFISVFSITYALYYLTLVLVVYIVSLLIKEKATIKKPIFLTTLIFLILNLCFYKYTQVILKGFNFFISNLTQIPQINIPNIIFPIGLSFITFRLIHYIIEIYRDKIKRSSLINFALYALFFPTFLAGPVERFPKFQSQTKRIEKPDFNQINYGLFRILSGIIKKFFIADNLYKVIIPVMNVPQEYSRVALIGTVYLAAIWLYMDLAGYTDMAIGISRLFGYNIIENFNWPYLKKNIAEFWRNWHISVYSWIRDYFYLPLFVYKGSKKKLYIGTFSTLMVFMLWHKASWGFLFAGVYHGVGLVGWNFFQELKKRFPVLRKIVNHKALTPLSIFITFSFVAFGIGAPFFGKNFHHIKILMLKLFGVY